MDSLTCFPKAQLTNNGVVSARLLELKINDFQAAAQFLLDIPYGLNDTKDDPLIAIKDNRGTCTTKHMCFATLAEELSIDVVKTLGIYEMTETIVQGTNNLLKKYQLPYIPHTHCFLEYKNYRVDLTEGNNNGKQTSIEDYIYTQQTKPDISPKEEYLIYKKILQEDILQRPEMSNIGEKTILKAREDGIKLIKANVLKPNNAESQVK